MACVGKALIVGGGIAGMSTAIVLRKLGVEVELVDLDPEWRVYGAGITITGPTLRAFDELGIFNDVEKLGYTGSGIRVCSMSGEQVSLLPTPMPADSSLPGSGGIMRPVLHKILSTRVVEAGARVRLGVTVESIGPDGKVLFSDGLTGKFDVIVGADGINSKVRRLVFPEVGQPFYTGQSCWRVATSRPAEIDRRHYFLGGPVKVGLSPVSDTEMYLFLLENMPQQQFHRDDSLLWRRLQALLSPYGGLLADVRNGLNERSKIVLRPLECLVVPAPWFSGRTILVGDAAHPTTPQLASGAGMAVEDALVLGQEIERSSNIEEAFKAFSKRRYERCRLVVDNSIEIGRREQEGQSIESQTELVEQSLQRLMEPI